MKIKLLLKTLFLVASQEALSCSKLPTCQGQEMPPYFSQMIGKKCPGDTPYNRHDPKVIGSVRKALNIETGEECYEIKHLDSSWCRTLCEDGRFK